MPGSIVCCPYSCVEPQLPLHRSVRWSHNVSSTHDALWLLPCGISGVCLAAIIMSGASQNAPRLPKVDGSIVLWCWLVVSHTMGEFRIKRQGINVRLLGCQVTGTIRVTSTNVCIKRISDRTLRPTSLHKIKTSLVRWWHWNRSCLIENDSRIVVFVQQYISVVFYNFNVRNSWQRQQLRQLRYLGVNVNLSKFHSPVKYPN